MDASFSKRARINSEIEEGSGDLDVDMIRILTPSAKLIPIFARSFGTSEEYQLYVRDGFLSMFCQDHGGSLATNLRLPCEGKLTFPKAIVAMSPEGLRKFAKVLDADPETRVWIRLVPNPHRNNDYHEAEWGFSIRDRTMTFILPTIDLLNAYEDVPAPYLSIAPKDVIASCNLEMEDLSHAFNSGSCKNSDPVFVAISSSSATKTVANLTIASLRLTMRSLGQCGTQPASFGFPSVNSLADLMKNFPLRSSLRLYLKKFEDSESRYILLTDADNLVRLVTSNLSEANEEG
jgi:hypothetical protein